MMEKFFSPIVVQIGHPLTSKRQTVHVDRLIPCLTPTEYRSQVVDPEPEPETPKVVPVLPLVYDTAPDADVSEVLPTHSIPVQTRAGRTVRPPLRYGANQ